MTRASLHKPDVGVASVSLSSYRRLVKGWREAIFVCWMAVAAAAAPMGWSLNRAAGSDIATEKAPTSGSTQDTVGVIRLRRQATVRGVNVLLRDIADLQGQAAEALGGTVVASLSANEQEVSVALASVQQELSKQGVHWGRMNLGGFGECRVWRMRPGGAGGVSDQTTQLPDSSVRANSVDEITLDQAQGATLQDKLNEWIAQFTGAKAQDLRVIFSERDALALSQNAGQDRYEFEPMGTGPLGRLPVTIRQYHNDTLTQTFQVTADIARKYLAVVVTKSISRGQIFTPGAVELREVYVDDNAGQPATDLSQVVGFQSESVLRPGAVVHSRHIQSPVWVKRGELLTVRLISGGLVVKTIARAMENGSGDQIIQVRNERSRQSYAVRVVGPKLAVAVPSDLSPGSRADSGGEANTTPVGEQRP